MPSTPVYGWPYLNRNTDSLTYGAVSGEDALLAIESTVSGLNTRVTEVEADVAALIYRATTTLAAPATSVSFTGIPSTLKALEVIWTSRDDLAGFNADTLQMRVNNDAGANYRSNLFQVNNTTLSGATVVGAVRAAVGITARGGATAGVFGAGKIVFSDWSAPHTGGLNWNFQSAILDSAVGTCWHQSGAGSYLGAGPYTRLDFFPDPAATNFVAGTQFALVGWS